MNSTPAGSPSASKKRARMQEDEPSPVSKDAHMATNRPSGRADTVDRTWLFCVIEFSTKSLPGGLPSASKSLPNTSWPVAGVSDRHDTTKRPSARQVTFGTICAPAVVVLTMKS